MWIQGLMSYLSREKIRLKWFVSFSFGFAQEYTFKLLWINGKPCYSVEILKEEYQCSLETVAILFY